MTTGSRICTAGTLPRAENDSGADRTVSGLDAIAHDVEQSRAEFGCEIDEIVFGVAEHFARHRGATLQGCGLTLEPATAERADLGITAAEDALRGAGPDDLQRPEALGAVYESLLDDAARRRGGVHYTPPVLARRLVDLVLERWDDASVAPRVLDPAMGGGAFLLAAARRQHQHGAAAGDAASVLDHLHGCDIDPVAVAVAETALALWAVEVGASPATALRAALVAGDALLDPLPLVECVVGNPPFQNQLKGSTVRARDRHAALQARFGDAVAAYADSAGLFLLAGLDALVDDGALLLIQPLSLLATRDAGEVRRRIRTLGSLHGVWFSVDDQFAAAVSVCAPVILTGQSAPPNVLIRRWEGSEVESRGSAGDVAGSSWGPLVADLMGVPPVDLIGNDTIGDLAEVTAGFRDQFYGFAPHTRELDEVAGGELNGGEDAGAELARVITVGMIDPLRIRWGRSTFRYAKTKWRQPVIDPMDIANDDEALGRWARARLRPKVVVATQTRVVETAVDLDGGWLPITPTISVEPSDHDRLWHLAAALSAPAVTAHLLAERVGTALAIDALMVSATSIAAVPLPSDPVAWDEGARAAEAAAAAAEVDDEAGWTAALDRLGETMQTAYNIADGDVLAWWKDRRPPWRDR